MVTPGACAVNPFEVGGTYSNISYYLKHKYKVITWSDFKMKFMKKEKEYTAIGNYQKFTKSDINAGDIIVFRNHEAGIAFPDADCVLFNNCKTYINFCSIKEELNDLYSSDWDVIEVRRPRHAFHFSKDNWHNAPVIWKREEVVEMTMEEVCKALGKNIKIIKSK